ncbi:uncharacterized protein LOC113758097 [Coffea eugenioides]|uniref:uncharacterized protein LOC113758097 n=1 Tax=Coffea eugenioides TaxID=49369 RepID=UPI000F6053FE|nr:uncharacterized protein LOC113758097 [Coffea eugenioides]
MVVPLARDSDVMFVTKSHVTSLQHWCKINFSHYDRTIQHYLTQIGSIHFSSISLSTLTELRVIWLPCPTDEANYDKFVVAGACLGASIKMADVEICCYHGYIGVLSRLTGEFQEAPHSSVVHEEDISETVQIKILDIFLWLYSWKHSTRT